MLHENTGRNGASDGAGPVGPFAGGPPPDALHVESPPLERFGLAELGRAVVVACALVAFVTWAILRWSVLRPVGRADGRSIVDAAAHGTVDAFEHLGPTFVKLGQLVASSPGLFPAPLADACLRMLDDVPTFPSEQARAVIEKDLGHKIGEMFSSFDDVPLAAASVAQVHGCVLRDGREAVIKVQRPGIARRMLVDLRAAYVGAKILRIFEFFRIANTPAIIRDLYNATMTELNAAVEADRQDRFRNNIGAFGDNRFVTVPDVYWNWCGPRVICMERLKGTPLDRVVPGADGLDTALLVRRGVKVWIEAVLLHGPFHGDVHAGNLWHLDDGRVALLDFGIVGELPEQWRTVLRELFRSALLDGDFSSVAKSIRELGVSEDLDVDDAEVGRQVAETFAPLLGRDLSELRLSALIGALVSLGRQWNTSSPEELVLFGKQVGYFERYATALAPGWVLGRDPFVFRNVFPEEVAIRIAESGVRLPD
ncbi:putative unusual protein kinase regulating ubiquinone biosynthesis (AarF/ABC1/UbiB family) [Rhodococcus sp. SMB37]|uniref:ABC1 kinase family protein n=1 Tax=Rhodococcus sp. SMB37 TaxID=2512213 RepID=UPI0010D55446|nr:AarF/UbiB family protein [Rhodococcus sp. SMB37]TCN50079.1 putative unusual protein kinase regulating ubiquinone biosynthesis (AarF/ABC1/UbiB family) [Rhodococcus sp. SMB37]